MLERFYTDSTKQSFIGKIANILKTLGLNYKLTNRLSKRDPQIPHHLLYTTDILTIKKFILRFKRKDNLKRRYLHYNGTSKIFIKWGIGKADCIYNMYIENYAYLEYAKKKGLKVVVDIYENPTTYKYLIDEIKNNPEYSIFRNNIKSYEYSNIVRMAYMEKILKLADYYTIPSQFVINSLYEFKNFNPNKVLFLPYASSILPYKYEYKPIKHRVIWVGNDPVRKGLLYCAKAADILKYKYPDLDFRVIGSVNDELKANQAFKNLNFIGVLDSKMLTKEYRSAEAYVFPTLFEGFAGTILEAASCGCPIITTECAGTDTDTFPALYIPTRNVDAIVNCVSKIFENKELQYDLSRKTYEYAKNLTPEIYENRIIEYFQNI